MRIHEFQAVVADPELCALVFRSDTMIKKKEVARRLFDHPEVTVREALLSGYVTKLLQIEMTAQQGEVAKLSNRLMQNVETLFLQKKGTLSRESVDAIQRVMDRHRVFQERGVQIAHDTLLSCGVPLPRLLESRDTLMRGHCSGAHELLEGIKHLWSGERVLPVSPFPFPTHGSDVHFEEQDFLLASLPKAIPEAEAYFNTCLARHVSLLVSLHEPCERPEKCCCFWHPSVLENMHLYDGWKIYGLTTDSIHQGTVPNEKGVLPRIMETSLFVHRDGSEPHSLIHLHYEGWVDGRPAPDEKLLEVLLNRMQELSRDPRNPIAINCQAGIGRTGVVAVSFFLRKKIDAARRLGLPLEEFQLNIPETLYQFRLQRHRLGSSAHQLGSLFSLAHSYYQQGLK
jgi:hypothetical protein